MARLMNRHRGWLKTVTYSMMHMAVAITVAYILSGSWVVALSIGLIEPLVQTCFYHMHEIAWGKINLLAR